MAKSNLQTKLKTGILGYGQIGQAVAKVCSKNNHVYMIKDVDKDEFEGEIDVLHVCIPEQDGFVDSVNNLVKKHNIGLVIIHSTVPVGTTEKIINAVHSPVRGVHPNLYEGIKTFVKYIGADDPLLAEKAGNLFEEYSIKSKIINNSRATELNKLLDTTYYGMCIEIHRFLKEACDFYEVDFETVTDFNKTYNEGYKKLGKEHVIRPVLEPPEGKIGGHCVLPNAEILQKDLQSRFLEEIFKVNKEIDQW